MRTAFSLAELMIALIILGFGLLVVGAALPIGITYTQDTAEISAGEAAVEYGLDEIERVVRLSKTARLDSLSRPREFDPSNPTSNGQLTGDRIARVVYNEPGFDYEPLIKVRPLVGLNLDVTPGGISEIQDHAEEMIRVWLNRQHGVNSGGPHYAREADPLYDALNWALGDIDGDGFSDSHGWNPVLSAVSRVFPPIPLDVRYKSVTDPYSNNAEFFGNEYLRLQPTQSEMEKVSERHVSWIAFYRRVSYARYSDPDLFEIIVIAVRKPTNEYRYPLQDPQEELGLTAFAGYGGGYDDDSSPGPRMLAMFSDAGAGGEGAIGNNLFGGGGPPPPRGGLMGMPPQPNQSPQFARALSRDSAVPVPWLVTFSALPFLQSPSQYDGGSPDRPLTPNFQNQEPATLVFRCVPSDSSQIPVGLLLPKGSIFIPAVNDDRPGFFAAPPGGSFNQYNTATPVRVAGFVPHAPSTLPIFEVVERPDPTTVIVKANGFYPWVRTDVADPHKFWPVWVIPPAIKERAGGEPVFEARSPVIAIARRYIRLSEIP